MRIGLIGEFDVEPDKAMRKRLSIYMNVSPGKMRS